MVALAILQGRTMPVDVEKGLSDEHVLALAGKSEAIIDQDLATTSREVVVTAMMESGNFINYFHGESIRLYELSFA